MLFIAIEFSQYYGMCLTGFADARYGRPFDPREANLEYELEDVVAEVVETATSNREISLIRPWLELMLSISDADIRAVGNRNVLCLAEAVLPHVGVDAMSDEGWHLVLEHLRQKVSGVESPMTAAERARARRELKLVDDPLEVFRGRMRSEGKLPDPA